METTKKTIELHFTPDKVEKYARKMILDAKNKKAPGVQVAMLEDIRTLVGVAVGILTKTQKPNV